MNNFDAAITFFVSAVIESLPDKTDYIEVKRQAIVGLRKLAQEMRDKYKGKE